MGDTPRGTFRSEKMSGSFKKGETLRFADYIRIPQKYSVTIYNDDFTPMDFVVYVLTDIFFLSEAKANELMLQVHHSEKAVVGVYTYDVAVSKAKKTTDIAREEGYPLRLTVEPIEM